MTGFELFGETAERPTQQQRRKTSFRMTGRISWRVLSTASKRALGDERASLADARVMFRTNLVFPVFSYFVTTS
jgi:hypothetical protein